MELQVEAGLCAVEAGLHAAEAGVGVVEAQLDLVEEGYSERRPIEHSYKSNQLRI